MQRASMRRKRRKRWTEEEHGQKVWDSNRRALFTISLASMRDDGEYMVLAIKIRSTQLVLAHIIAQKVSQAAYEVSKPFEVVAFDFEREKS